MQKKKSRLEDLPPVTPLKRRIKKQIAKRIVGPIKKEKEIRGRKVTDLRTKLKILIIIVLLVIVVFLLIALYFYFKSPERQLRLGANIEAAILSQDKQDAYISIIGGSEQNITKIKFVFTDVEGEGHYYETTEGAIQVSVAFKRNFWDWLFGRPRFEGNYEYKIDAEDAGLPDFYEIDEVSVVFEYMTEEGELVETPVLDTQTTRTITVSSSGNGGGNGGTTTTCSPEPTETTCGAWICGNRNNNCGDSVNCGICLNNLTCATGICINETGNCTDYINNYYRKDYAFNGTIFWDVCTNETNGNLTEFICVGATIQNVTIECDINCTDGRCVCTNECVAEGLDCQGDLLYNCTLNATTDCFERTNLTDCAALGEICYNGECTPPIECTHDNNCSINNLTEISNCTNDPDANPFTFDFRAAFTSECNLTTNSCTTGDSSVTSTCDTPVCGAPCDATNLCTNNTCSVQYDDYCSNNYTVEYDTDRVLDSTTIEDTCENTCQLDCSCTSCSVDCSAPATNTYCVLGVCGADCETTCTDKDCDYLDGCVDDDYYDYDDVSRSCVDCQCDDPVCDQYNVITNACAGCTHNDNCTYLDNDICGAGNEIMWERGVCNATLDCEVQTSVFWDCDNNDTDYCNGDNVEHRNYTCSNAECIIDTVSFIEDCNTYNNNYCTGLERMFDNYTCSGAACVVDTSSVVEDCDDSVSCTEDLCTPSQCVRILNNTKCDDGSFCNGTETCSFGGCLEGTPPTCTDPFACTTDTCSDVLGICEFIPNNSLCQTWEECSVNVGCNQTNCSGCTDCDDWWLWGDCDYDECHNQCSVQSACYFVGAFAGQENCVNLSYACSNLINSCDDYSVEECVDDPCNRAPVQSNCSISGNSCIITPYCGDGVCGLGDGNCPADVGNCTNNICYEPVCNDGCSETAVSAYGNDEACLASNNEFCDGFGNCVECINAGDCDDGILCTSDNCSEAIGDCFFNTSDCNCSAAGPAPIECDDSNICTDDVCTASLDCQNNPNTNSCDDLDDCTYNDACSGNSCSGTSIISCDYYTSIGLAECEADACTPVGCQWNAGVCEQIPVDFPTDFISWWKFDETSGTIAYDETGINNGTLMNGADFVTDVSPDNRGQVLDLDGTDDHVICGNDASLNLQGSLTLLAWIYPRSFGTTYPRIFDKGYTSNAGYAFMLSSSDSNTNYMTYGTGVDVYSNPNVVSLNSWQHVVVVHDGTNIIFYVDGQEVGTASGASPPDSLSSELYIGMRDSNERQFDGLMDDAMIYDRSLSAAEILEIYNSQLISCENDNDGDGYGVGPSCLGADCDDGNVNIWQNLSGYIDNDNDGYGAGGLLDICSGASLPLGYASVDGDCNDTNEFIFPGSSQPNCDCAGSPTTETCDGFDNDCDGIVDGPGVCALINYYCDEDGDGFNSSSLSGSCSIFNCLPAGCSETVGTDCDDYNGNIYPGAPEICDGVDNQCPPDGDIDVTLDVPCTLPNQCISGRCCLDSEAPFGECDIKIYYVLPDGIGSGTVCTDAQPCNLTYVRGVVQPGEFVYLKDGNYGAITFLNTDYKGGSSDADYIVYRADPATTGSRPADWWETPYDPRTLSNRVVFDGLTLNSDTAGNGLYLEFDNIDIIDGIVYGEDYISHLRLKNLSISGTSDLGLDSGIYFRSGASIGDFHDILIENCYIEKTGNGIQLENDMHGNIVFRNNHLYYIPGSGIRLIGPTNHGEILIEGNHIEIQIEELKSHGSALSLRCDGITFRNNVVHSFGSSAGVMLYGPDAGGGQSVYNNIRFENNLFYDIWQYAIRFERIGVNFTFNNNTIIGDYRMEATGDYRYYESVLLTGMPGSDFEMKNNIIVSSTNFRGGSSTISNFDEGNNIYWVVHDGTSWPSTFGTNSIVARYVDSDYFEGSGKFFKGGALFDQWSYERIPEFTPPLCDYDVEDAQYNKCPHSQNLNYAYVPMITSEACNGSINAPGVAVGALPCVCTNDSQCEQVFGGGYVCDTGTRECVSAPSPECTTNVNNAAELNTAKVNANPGDTICLMTGNYGEFRFEAETKAGTPGNWITYKAAPGEKPVFDTLLVRFIPNAYISFQNIDIIHPSGASQFERTISVDDISHLEFKNCTIKGAWHNQDASLRSQTIRTWNNGPVSDLTIEGCDIIGGNDAINLGNDVRENIKIINNKIHRFRGAGIEWAPSNTDVSNILIEGNEIYDTRKTEAHGSVGIALRGANAIIRNNIVRQHGGSSGIGGTYPITGGQRNTLIEKNLVYDSGGTKNIYISNAISNVTIRYNTAIGYRKNEAGFTEDYENTMTLSPTGIPTNINVSNNIFVGPSNYASGMGDYYEDNNIMWSYSDSGVYQQDPKGANSILVVGPGGFNPGYDENYFEGSGNFFLGGNKFDKYAYTHGTTFDFQIVSANASADSFSITPINNDCISYDDMFHAPGTILNIEGGTVTAPGIFTISGSAAHDGTWTIQGSATFSESTCLTTVYVEEDVTSNDAGIMTYADPLSDGGTTSHRQNLNDAFVPVMTSDACSGGIITHGHLAGQACAAGAPAFPAGLVSWWRFDETSGTIAYDSVGNNDGAVFGEGDEFVNDADKGRVISLDGAGDYVDVAHSPELNFDNRNFTVSIWVKTSKTSAQGLVEKQVSPCCTGLFLTAIDRDNVHDGGFSIWDGNSWINSNSQTGLVDGNWHQLAFTYDGTDFSLYKDGQLDRTVISSEAYNGTQTLPLSFGEIISHGTDWWFDGEMDDIMLFNRSLNSSEVLEIYNSQKQPELPCNLTNAYWNTTSATEGELVELILEGNNCAGKQINFTIYEDDALIDDLIVSIIDNFDRTIWTSQWVDDGVGDPEYYFNATLVENESVSVDSQKLLNPLLTVSQCTDTCISLGYECGTHTICGLEQVCGDCSVLYGDNYICNASNQCEIDACYGFTSCGNYTIENDCNNDVCDVPGSCSWNGTDCEEIILPTDCNKFVEVGGVSYGDCSDDAINPACNLGYARDNAVGGDIICLRNGTYGDFTDTRIATGTEWITYKAADGETPVLGQVTIGASGTSNAYIELDGLTITGGILLLYRHHINIKNCDISTPDYDTWAIDGQYDTAYITIENNDIHHARRGICYAGPYAIIKNNKIHDTCDDGITDSYDNLLIEGNEIWDLDRQKNPNWETMDIHTDGMQVWCLDTSHHNITIRGNTIHSSDLNGGGAIFISARVGAWTDIVVENNLIYDIVDGYLLIGTVNSGGTLYFNNNTIIESIPAINMRIYYATEVHNNILSKMAFNEPVTSHGNNIFGSSPAGLIPNASSLVLSQTEFEDLFVDYDGKDYHPKMDNYACNGSVNPVGEHVGALECVCTDDSQCEDVFGAGYTCNVGTGECVEAIENNNLTQYGITWFFDKEVTTQPGVPNTYQYGTFANGDYWIVPENPGENVTIVGIDPASTDNGTRIMHGSMLNPSPTLGSAQGYDNAVMSGATPVPYDPNLNVVRPNEENLSANNPLTIQPGFSLVSSISLPEPGISPQLKTAAVLTVLNTPIQNDYYFRPPYVNLTKEIKFNKDQLNYSLLSNLVPIGLPRLEQQLGDLQHESVERMFERPWIDHIPTGMGSPIHPADNMLHYGAYISHQTGIGALTLHSDYTNQEKETLLIRYVQLGIDLYGVAQEGGYWESGGGHGHGRKWPILFSGLILNDVNMTNIGEISGAYAFADGYEPGNPHPNYVNFGEDDDTFYVEETSPGVYNYGYGGSTFGVYLAEDVGLPEYGTRHAYVLYMDSKNWSEESYRGCCSAVSWGGSALAAHIMGVEDLWNKKAFFDYMDRYLEIGLQYWGYGWPRQGPAEEMWDAYRADYGCFWTRDDTTPCTSANVHDPTGSCYSQGHYNCSTDLFRCNWSNSVVGIEVDECSDYTNNRSCNYDPCNLGCGGVCEEVQPTEFYVSPTGAGTACSEVSPCTLAEARSQVQPGGTVYLMDGNYSVVNFDSLSEKGNSWNEPITYKDYTGADPIIEELYMNDVGDSYLIFDGLHFQAPDSAHSRVVQIEGSSRHIKIANCEAEDRAGWLDATNNAVIQTTDDGVEIPQDITVDNCDVHTGRKGIGGSAESFIITNNHVHYISDSGIKVGGDGPVLIENNHVHNQDPTLRFNDPHGTGISVRSINTVIRNNTIHDYGNSILGINFYNDSLPTEPHETGYINILVENNLIYDPLDGKTAVGFEVGMIGNNFTFRNNTIIGYLSGNNYGYRFGSGVLVGLDTQPPTPFHSTYIDGEFKFYDNIIVGQLVFFNGQTDFDRISEGGNIVWALLQRGEPFYTEFSSTSTSKILAYGSTVGGYMIHGDPEDYFEGSGNFFKGGADFDTYSYTMPGGGSHGVNLNDAYYPMITSEACNGSINPQGVAVGALPCVCTNNSQCEQVFGVGYVCDVNGGCVEVSNLPLYSTFDGATTDFSAEPDITQVQNAILENTTYGMINFSGQTIDFSGLDLDTYVSIGNNSIIVDSVASPQLNVSAVLTVYGNFTDPEILQDGQPCSSGSHCNIIENTGSYVKFTIDHFTNFTVREKIPVPQWCALHFAHTTRSDGTSSPTETRDRMKQFYDCGGTNDHDTSLDQAEWDAMISEADTYNIDNNFTYFFGTEWSGGQHIYYLTLNPSATQQDAGDGSFNEISELSSWLSQNLGVGQYNHPARISGDTDFTNPAEVNETYVPLVEMINNQGGTYYWHWNYYFDCAPGICTTYQNPEGAGLQGAGGTGWVKTALEQGYHLGFSCGNDMHEDVTVWTPECYTGLANAYNFTRGGVYWTLMDRHTWAAENKIVMDVGASNGTSEYIMGDIFSYSSPISNITINYNIDAAPGYNIDEVNLFYNGEIIDIASFSGQQSASGNFVVSLTEGVEDYVFIEAIQDNGQRAWSSPMYITYEYVSVPSLSPLAAAWNWVKGLLTQETGQAILTGRVVRDYFSFSFNTSNEVL